MADAAPGLGPAPAPLNTAAADLVCGVLQIGVAQVAVPIDVLREVVPCPAVLHGLPAAAPGLLGAVRLRGRVVPVVDLRAVLGQPAARDPGQVVVVMRHGGRLLGLLADAVCGLTTLGRGQLGSMESGCGSPGTLLFAGSFERSSDGSVVSLLDPAAVMRLPGLPLLRDAGKTSGPAGAFGGSNAEADAGASATRPVLLVRCGGIGLAVEVGDVHATLPAVTLLPSSLDGALCRGVVEHAGVRLPAVDTLALLELGALARDEPCQALLLQHGNGQVALLVSRVVDIVSVPVAALAPLAPLAVRRPALFAASMRIDGHGEHLLLAAGALLNAPQLVALAAMNTRAVAAPRARAAAAAAPGVAPSTGLADAAGSGTDVITYSVGVETATPLAQVLEVLGCPSDLLRPERAHRAGVGAFTHRGRGVTLLCLQTLLNGDGDAAAVAPAQSATARVLLVDVDGARFGFVVPALLHIDRAVWERRPQTGGDRAARAGSAAEHGLVEVQGNGHRRTLRLVDLHALARSLVPQSPSAAAPAGGVPAASPPQLALA